MNSKSIAAKIGILSILATFTQCASSQRIDTSPPLKIENPYYQNWISEEDDSITGFLVYIPVEDQPKIELHTIYFKGKKIGLTRKENEAVYVGTYTYPSKKKDLIMSDDPKEEFGNELPIIEEKIPFRLKPEECVIGYTKNNKSGFFRLEKVTQKKLTKAPE